MTTLKHVLTRLPTIPLATPTLRCAHAFASLRDAWAEYENAKQRKQKETNKWPT